MLGSLALVALIIIAIIMQRKGMFENVVSKEKGSISAPSQLPREVSSEISDTYDGTYDDYGDNLYEDYTERYLDYPHFRSNFVSKTGF